MESTSDSVDYFNIPLVDIKLCAGNGILIFEELVVNYLPMRSDWFIKCGINPKNVDFVSVKGDCMEDYLIDGDLVLIDKNQTEIQNGNIFAFRYGEELMVKRLFKSGNEIIAKPDNTKHPTIEISPEKAETNGFAVIGKIVFRMGNI